MPQAKRFKEGKGGTLTQVDKNTGKPIDNPQVITKNNGTPTPAVPTPTTSGSTPVNPIPSTPPIISSKDMAGSYNTNSGIVDTKLGELAKVTGGSQSEKETKTTVDANASPKGGKDQTPTTGGTTGDPLYDSLEAWKKTQADALKVQSQERRASYNNLYKNAFAAVDSTYAATLADISSTYESRLAEQERINQLDIARTRAYGLGGSNALAAPLEFSAAISGREQKAASEITRLNNERTALIAKARAARDSGKATLLQTQVDKIYEIEDKLREQIADVAVEATNQYNMLVKIRQEQEAKQKEQAAAFIAQAALDKGKEWEGADNVAKDKIIRDIIARSGGVLDYATVYATLNDTVTKAAADAADLAYKRAQTTKLWKDIEKGDSPASDPYAAINQLLGLKNEQGVPYSTAEGYITWAGFNAISAAAKEDGVSRKDLLAEYGYMLQPGADGDYEGYDLTKAEIKALKGD